MAQDDAVSKAHRRLRAEALRELGNIFLAASRKAAEDKAAHLGPTSGSASGGSSSRPQAAAVAVAGGGGATSGGSRGGAEQRRRQREEEERRRQEQQAQLAKQQMEDAMIRVMQKRQGQED